MTENISTTNEPAAEDTTVEPAEMPVDATEPAPEQSPTANDPNSEARGWRLKYRAANTELTIANARISELNRMRAEEVLSKKLADPKDAWTFGGDLNAMLNDVGLVDDDAVRAFAEDLCAAKPYLAARLTVVGAPASAMTSDDPIPTPGSGTPSWHDILSGKDTG